MRNPARLATVALLATLIALAVPVPLPASDFPHFDAMNDEMRTEYLVLMVDSMEQAFRTAGQANFADQTEKLFATVEPGDSVTLGMVELLANVDRARVADLDNLQKNPQANRVLVEVALFVTLEKNNMMPTTPEMEQVITALGKYHWMTLAEFQKLSAADQRRIITLDANLGFFTLTIYSQAADALAGKKKTTDPDEEKADALMERQIINDEFLSPSAPGFPKVKQQIADAYAKTPNDPGVLFNVVKYILSETDDRIVAEMKQMENSTYHLGDSAPPSAWQQIADFLKKAAAASQSPAPSAAPPSAPPPSAPPSAPPPAASSDDGPIIKPPSTFPAMICVEQSLVDNQAFNSPPAGIKMESFKGIAANYVHDTGQVSWQYLLTQQNYDRFDPSANPNPAALVLSVSPDDHDVFGGCPSGYATYTITISH
jgi:hypothetical protein